jgi:amino acid permease
MAHSSDSGDGSGSHDIREEEDRSMGFWSAAAIGVGTMIAAGIFVLSGLAVSNVGTVAIVSFLIPAFVASLTAASYAEFSSVYPQVRRRPRRETSSTCKRNVGALSRLRRLLN